MLQCEGVVVRGVDIPRVKVDGESESVEVYLLRSLVGKLIADNFDFNSHNAY